MNQLATDFLKARFYSGQITGEELMRRVEAEVRREIAAEIEQIRGERDETAKELSDAKALISERESRLANIKFLLEPIYGSTNYAPIGSVLARVVDICDRFEAKDPDANLRAACLNVIEKAQLFRSAASWDEQSITAERYSDAYNALNAAIDAANTVAK